MDMFSKELYELDKNTVQYMIDEQEQKIGEMQETIDKQNQTIDEMQEEHIKAIDGMQEEHIKTIDEMQKEYSKKIDVMRETHIKEMDGMQKQAIRNAMKILRDLKLPEQEIRARICEQYQISEEQVEELLN